MAGLAAEKPWELRALLLLLGAVFSSWCQIVPISALARSWEEEDGEKEEELWQWAPMMQCVHVVFI